MTNYDLANERIADDLENNKVDTTTDNINANNYAKNIMNSYEKDIDNSPHLAHERQEHQQEPMLPPMSTPRQDMSSSQYLPPVPPQQQQPVPQQSQHMNVVQQVQQSSQQPMNGDYTGFDSSDNLSPLDSSFTPIKEPIRQRANVNSDPRTNETVEPYTNENEMFSSF